MVLIITIPSDPCSLAEKKRSTGSAYPASLEETGYAADLNRRGIESLDHHGPTTINCDFGEQTAAVKKEIGSSIFESRYPSCPKCSVFHWCGAAAKWGPGSAFWSLALRYIEFSGPVGCIDQFFFNTSDLTESPNPRQLVIYRECREMQSKSFSSQYSKRYIAFLVGHRRERKWALWCFATGKIIRNLVNLLTMARSHGLFGNLLKWKNMWLSVHPDRWFCYNINHRPYYSFERSKRYSLSGSRQACF